MDSLLSLDSTQRQQPARGGTEVFYAITEKGGRVALLYRVDLNTDKCLTPTGTRRERSQHSIRWIQSSGSNL